MRTTGLVTGPELSIANFVAEKTGRTGEPWGEIRTLGWLKDSNLVAGVLYNHFSLRGCCIHVAAESGKRWLTPEFLFVVFDAPFRAWGLERLTGLVPENNIEAITFDEHLGFTYEGTLREALPDGRSLLIYGMLKRECRWISDEFAHKVWVRQQMRQKPLSAAFH